ncbi:coiled-coil-helix-coiled-coil-helix domain containing 3a isoform X2 [Pimephales promelas]|uniref:coiled-coil-helix-coiled-coil-helix domain containing 3a isoform X2 n=1 Tax=Pimephales promelas TaxID=90988 RepID=UPI00195560EF|nr:coiled-coil-helix-coiled-coil-helix domain containing 3a isoform X2 [Pimephales promelas]KAG1952994.1 MICOS complex subunit Mic19 [Pimephales promelas]
MGANSSTRRVSFESDENENITIVKGIRLSEKVIDRMREPSGPPRPQAPSRTPPPSPPVVDPLPALVPISPPSHPVTSLPPPPLPGYVKLPEQVTTPAPPPPPPPVEAAPAASVGVISTPAETIPTHPITKTAADPVSASPVEITDPSPPAEFDTPVAFAAETIPHPPPSVDEPVASPPPPPTVGEFELRRKITEELEKGLEEERRKAQEELNQRLEKERSRVHAQAHAEAQALVKDEVSRILALEKASAEESIQKAILRERVTAEDERLQAQIYQMERKARQLEERDKELRKQDTFYREQVAKLKERSGEFYKVSNDNFHKAADEVNAKFKRYEISPVCTDLQGQILKCYRENAGKTLLCSNIASQYLQCVNNAKQDKLRTGG